MKLADNKENTIISKGKYELQTESLHLLMLHSHVMSHTPVAWLARFKMFNEFHAQTYESGVSLITMGSRVIDRRVT